MTMIKYSIFGPNGRIGRALVRHLFKDRDVEVRCMPRNVEKSDLRDLGSVVYAAGLTADFRQRPFDTMRAHVTSISDILEFGTFDSLTYLSSTRLYQHASSGSVDAKFTVDSQSPCDIYTLSKLSGEALCLQANEAVRVARLSNVVGLGEVGADTFVGAIAQEAMSGCIKFRTSQSSAKDYIWLDDVVQLLVEIPVKAHQRIYNLASGQKITNKEWAAALKNQTGCEIIFDENAPEIVFHDIDIEKTKADFGFRAVSVIERVSEICQMPMIK